MSLKFKFFTIIYQEQVIFIKTPKFDGGTCPLAPPKVTLLQQPFLHKISKIPLEKVGISTQMV